MGKQRVSKLDRSVAGKVVLVTGAASGMGRATAYLFADEGAKVAATDVRAEGARRRSPPRSPTPAARPRPGSSTSANGDEIKRVVDAVADRFGGLDIVVNNAGIALVDADRRRRLRGALGALARRAAHRAHPHHPRRAALPAQVEVAAHHQHRVDRGPGRHRRATAPTPRRRPASSASRAASRSSSAAKASPSTASAPARSAPA